MAKDLFLQSGYSFILSGINFYFQKIAYAILLCLLLSASVFSQNKKPYNLFSAGDNSLLTKNTELKNSVDNAVILNINRNELLNLSNFRNPEIALNVPFLQNAAARLSLNRFEILKPGAKIVARTAQGNEEISLNDIAVSYTGKVEGINNSFAAFTFSRDNVNGLIMTPRENYILGAIKDSYGNLTDNYILYKESDLKIKNSFHCETEEILSQKLIDRMKQSINQQMNEASATDLYVAEIAMEIDFVTYNYFNSSVSSAVDFTIRLMTSTSAIFMKDINIKLVIPFMRVWTVQDPYTGTTAGTLLSQFQTEWNTNMQFVQRTVAYLISTRSGSLGTSAYTDVLCASTINGNGYGFSQLNDEINPLPLYSWGIVAVSHGLGHIFGSPHTNNCSWPGGPIDTCWTVEGGCYSGPLNPIVGTIMSLCPAISLVQGFGTLPNRLIRTNAEAASCMYISNRPVAVAYPNGGEKFIIGNSMSIYWGTSLTGNVNIEFSGNNGVTWQTIQNNVPGTDRNYVWTIPELPSSTVQGIIRVMDSSNPSVGDTSDAGFQIAIPINSVQNYSPPNNSTIIVSSASNEIQQFIWSRGGYDLALRYKFRINKVGNVSSYNFGSDNNESDTIISLRKSFLDSLTQTLGTTGDSVRCIWRAIANNGIDSSVGSPFNVTLRRSSVGINVISSAIPEKFSLGNNYPNPFNPATNIKFDIAKATFAELKIFDLSGREVQTLVNEKLQPGSYEYNFNAGNLSSGAYFYRLKTYGFVGTRRMVLVK